MVAAFRCERLLGEVALSAQFRESLREGAFLRGRLFLSGWHLAAGVCGMSMNTSTKYSSSSWGGKTESALEDAPCK